MTEGNHQANACWHCGCTNPAHRPNRSHNLKQLVISCAHCGCGEWKLAGFCRGGEADSSITQSINDVDDEGQIDDQATLINITGAG